MNKTQHLNFRITDEEHLMFEKICNALIGLCKKFCGF